MKTLSVHTLGCRINRFDSSAVLEAARAAGYEVRPDAPRADVLV
ncbi:MAG: tRNA (N(6)-L-threonylcarbamoyladenosine(37)-C(2))-methylthiotransferase MtaB, partial [Candidatus Methylomirabilis sp.]|nr:tRNA (N(6)-L-threonylcarbamoyladenosine(37)-C(2))-methylthiotransferase MtaB [Deltaproteobacteria bacterium]